MKRVVSLISTFLLLLAITGCTVPTDPYVDGVNKAVSQTLFEATGEMASGCIGIYLVCSQPTYEPSYTAPASARAERVCSDLSTLGQKLGAVAYSSFGSQAYPLQKSMAEFVEFCSQSLSTKLKAGDGSPFYQGVVLYDDGLKDGWGKVYSLSKGNSVNPEDYFLVISFSKDLDRVGWIDYQPQKPKVLTQEELDLRY